MELEDMVGASLQPLMDLEVPTVLRASIDRHGRTLLELAAGLLKTGMNESQVRDVINRACTSYRDELVATIISLKEINET